MVSFGVKVLFGPTLARDRSDLQRLSRFGRLMQALHDANGRTFFTTRVVVR